MNIGHGLGVADINGDGRGFLNAYGWWEQPAEGTTGLWTHHPTRSDAGALRRAAPAGRRSASYDVNGDGLMDAVGPQEGHGFGIAWWEQKSAASKITFVEHEIMDNFLTKNAGDVIFTEPHAATCATSTATDCRI